MLHVYTFNHDIAAQCDIVTLFESRTSQLLFLPADGYL